MKILIYGMAFLISIFSAVAGSCVDLNDPFSHGTAVQQLGLEYHIFEDVVLCPDVYNNVELRLNTSYIGLDCAGSTLLGSDTRIAIANDQNTQGFTIQNCIIENYGTGILMNNANLNFITSNHIHFSLNNSALSLIQSDLNLVVDNTFTNNLRGIELLGGSWNIMENNFLEDNHMGVFMQLAFENNISSSHIVNNVWGIFLQDSSFNRIWNNVLDNSNNALENDLNFWNLFPQPGVNIIGGPFIAGNFWSDYFGDDLDADGLGDTLVPHTASGFILDGDFHPLVDAFVPTCTVNGQPVNIPLQVQECGTLRNIVIDCGVDVDNMFISSDAQFGFARVFNRGVLGGIGGTPRTTAYYRQDCFSHPQATFDTIGVTIEGDFGVIDVPITIEILDPNCLPGAVPNNPPLCRNSDGDFVSKVDFKLVYGPNELSNERGLVEIYYKGDSDSGRPCIDPDGDRLLYRVHEPSLNGVLRRARYHHRDVWAHYLRNEIPTEYDRFAVEVGDGQCGRAIINVELELPDEIGYGGGFARCLPGSGGGLGGQIVELVAPNGTRFNLSAHTAAEIAAMNFNFTKFGLKNFSQFANITWGQNSCGPTSVAVSLDYFNRTGFSGLTKTGIQELIDDLRRRMRTNAGGTDDRNVLLGKIDYLNNVSFAQNFTIKWINPTASASGNNAVIVHRGVRLNLTVRSPNYNDYVNEMERGEDVTMIYRNTGLGISHFMTGYAFQRQNNTNGRYNVSFMDPTTNSYIVLEMDSAGTIYTPGASFSMVSMESVSPR